MVSPSHATPLLGLSLSLSLSLFSPLPLSNYCCYHYCFYCIYILPTTTVVPPFLTRLSLPPISLPLLSYSLFPLSPPISLSLSLSPLPPFGTSLWVVRSAHQKLSPPPYPIPKRSFFNSSPPTPLQQHNYHHHHHDATPLDQRCHETTLDFSAICSQIPLMETLIPLFFRVTTHQ